MSKYTIGFYNNTVDDPNILSECNIVFNDFDKLKQHLRIGDTIVLASVFSLYGIPVKEVATIKEDYELTIRIKDNAFINTSDNISGIYVTMATIINEFILDHKETILKLLENS